MTYDERDRRDWPEEGATPPHDGGADATQPPREPEAAGDPVTEPQAEPAPPRPDETGTWPSVDTAELSHDRSGDEYTTDAPSESRAAWRTDAPSTSERPADAWPTEPPAAGDARAGAWPTTPPERGEEPILDPDADVDARSQPDSRFDQDPIPGPTSDDPLAHEAPPSEVEAYPAAAAGGTGSATDEAPPTQAHAVPAAESATGESTQCPRCGTENRPGLAFCRNCGQRLVAAGVASTVERPGTPEGTQSCPRCGTHNRVGVAFCQNCGANLRGVAPGYVPPAVADEEAPERDAEPRRGAILGPVVLLIGLVGLITGYLLPFALGTGSLFDRAWGADGYGVAFWSAYPDVAGLAEQAYFGFAAPVPILGLLLLALAIAGFVRAAPGRLQVIGLVITLLWSVGLAVLFLVVELFGNWDGDLVGLLRNLSAGGIILFLTALIILIGSLTRFARS